MNDFGFMFLKFLVLFGICLGVVVAAWHILHYIDEKPKVTTPFVLKWLGWTIIVVTVFVSTYELPLQLTKITEISKSELQSDYKLNNDITTGRPYSFYKFINTKTGQVIVLPDTEYLKINCENFKLNVFEVKRVDQIMGQIYVHNYSTFDTKIECINN